VCFVAFLASYRASPLYVTFALRPYFRALRESCEANRAIVTRIALHNYELREPYA
jgi:hypothetical protein